MYFVKFPQLFPNILSIIYKFPQLFPNFLNYFQISLIFYKVAENCILPNFFKKTSTLPAPYENINSRKYNDGSYQTQIQIIWKKRHFQPLLITYWWIEITSSIWNFGNIRQFFFLFTWTIKYKRMNKLKIFRTICNFSLFWICYASHKKAAADET